MIDKVPDPETPPAGLDAAEQNSDEKRELFLDLFDQTSEASVESSGAPPARSAPTPAAVHPQAQPQIEAPSSPQSLEGCGLTLMQVSDLVTKELYLHGHLLGVDIARHIRLPFPIVDEALKFLKAQKTIEVSSGDVIGTASYCFNLTELGQRRAKEAFEKCGYVGPAPVSLEQYVTQCRRQAVSMIDCSIQALEESLHGMVIPDDLLAELGPAVCSGKSIFIHGPPGNGKTILAKGLGRFLNRFGGEIYIPYAVQAENSVITVLDPTIHTTVDDNELFGMDRVDGGRQLAGEEFMSNTMDLRWRRIRRPVVITGGELTLDMLDLRYNTASSFYTAPLHIKANGGVFLIDDFGRQLVSPRDLLNRWILPLEEQLDYLTLGTGKKIAIPFEQLIIFSTNIEPRELVDDAFLRRIRHKIRIDAPNRSVFEQIFRGVCTAKQIAFSESAIEYLFTNFYEQGRSPRASDPRDLVEIVQSICRFRGQPPVVTAELIAEATAKFFATI